MWKRVLDGLLTKNKNRRHFKIGTTDGYYYQIEFDRLTNLPNLSFSFMEAILADTQKHNTFEHKHLADFIEQIASEGFTAHNIKTYFIKNFAFEPWVALNAAQGRILEGSFDNKENKFFLKKPSVFFKYQFLFFVASMLYYTAQHINKSQIADFDKKLNQNIGNNLHLLIKAG